MYRITLCDLSTHHEKDIYATGSSTLTAYNIKLSEKVNGYGTLTMSFPNTQKIVDTEYGLNSVITVYDDNENVLWSGIVISIKDDMFGCTHLTAYGMLWILTFQLLIPKVWNYPDTIGNVTSWIASHNNVDEGSGTSINPNYEIGFSFDGGEYADPVYDVSTEGTTLDTLKKLCEPYYYFYPTYSAPLNPYLYGNPLITINIASTNSADNKVNQPIAFGLNLLEYMNESSIANYKTSVAPIGKDGNGNIVTVGSVSGQNGSGYIKLAPSIIAEYGERRVRVNFDNISDPNQLYQAGSKWLQNNAFQELTLTIKAADLALLTSTSFAEFKVGYWVDVNIVPFGIKTSLPILEKNYDLVNPAKSALTISNTYQISLSEILRGKS